MVSTIAIVIIECRSCCRTTSLPGIGKDIFLDVPGQQHMTHDQVSVRDGHRQQHDGKADPVVKGHD